MRERTLRRGAAMRFAILVVLSAVPTTWGHGTAPPPPPTPPDPGDAPGAEIVEIFPPRWSWLHWWEANRDPYLGRTRQGGSNPQDLDAKAVGQFRAKASEALLKAARDSAWQARAAAALSLGRMQEAKALPVLKDLAARDRVETVRLFALVGVGLLGGAEAETFLLEQRYPTDKQREAALAGAGLIASLSPDTIVGVQKILQTRHVGAATLAAWLLRFRSDPKTREFLKRVIQGSKSPWLASESLLSLGLKGAEQNVTALAKILLNMPEADAVAAWRDLRARHRALAMLAARLKARKVAYDKAYEDYKASYEKWKEGNPNADGPAAAAEADPRKVVIGLELIYLARLRASAAIALGRIGTPQALRALRSVLNLKSDDYSDLYKGQAIMALGRAGDVQAVEALLGILRGVRVGMSAEKKDSPLRGYAALALGLYARRDPKLQDRPKFVEIARILAGRLADLKETREVRAAAAMALGLTNRTENLRLLHQAGKTVGKSGDQVLVGYLLLARGMLGDSNMVAAAGKFLAVANDSTSMSGILSRRAAVLGVGVLGRQEGIPILMKAWRLNYYANREVTLALALCQAYNATDALVKLLRESDNALEKAFAAQCLGEMFSTRRPGMLSRLVLDSNYMVKNIKMLRYQAIANEFLFTYLIPAFGKEWR